MTETVVDWQDARLRLRGFLGQALGGVSHADLDDLTQEAAVGFLRSLRREPAQSPLALMATIARRTAINFIRRRRRWALIVQPAMDLVHDCPDPRTHVADDLGDPETRVRFVVLGFFREQKLSCVELAEAFFEGLAWPEVARSMGIAHDSVRKRWERCVAALRAAVKTDQQMAMLSEWAKD